MNNRQYVIWIAKTVGLVVCIPLALLSFAIGAYLLTGRVPLPAYGEMEQEVASYAPTKGVRVFVRPEPLWEVKVSETYITFLQCVTVGRTKGGIEVKHFILPWISEVPSEGSVPPELKRSRHIDSWNI